MRALRAHEKRAVEAAAIRLFETKHTRYAPTWNALTDTQRVNLRRAIREPVMLYLEALEASAQTVTVYSKSKENDKQMKISARAVANAPQTSVEIDLSLEGCA